MDYSRLVAAYDALEKTTKKLEKTAILAEVLKEAKADELPYVVYLMQGKVFPPQDDREIGMSSRLAIRAIANAMHEKNDKTIEEKIKAIELMFNREGDLGLVAEKLLANGRQTTLFSHGASNITVKKVVDDVRALTGTEGKGSVERKMNIVIGLVNSATPHEAKYIIRTILENLRTGVGEGILRDALVWAFLPKVAGLFPYCGKCNEFSGNQKCRICRDKIGASFKDEMQKKFRGRVWRTDSPEELLKDLSFAKHADVIISQNEENARKIYTSLVEQVQAAYDLATDYGIIAQKLKEKGLEGLKEIRLKPGRALKLMLFVKAEDSKDAFDIVGKPAIAERKFDGFRMQIHGINGEIKLFTRRLDEVTPQFPDVVEYVKGAVKAKSFILDGEVVGIDAKTKKFVPFQNISHRIRRKYNIEQMTKEIPVIVELFDAIEINGKNLLNEPFVKRRKELEKVVKEEKGKIVLVEQCIVHNEDELREFYHKVLEEGVEGVMLKNKGGIYKPGARVGYGVKLKPTMENLDLVIVKAEWGEGKRASWFSSFTLACRDGDDLREIGKVGSGIKEKAEEGVSFEELTNELTPLVEEAKGTEVTVKPKIVVEVAYQEIQKSPTYDSGYALRFPRVVRLRTMEKSVADINTLEDVERLYRKQAASQKKV